MRKKTSLLVCLSLLFSLLVITPSLADDSEDLVRIVPANVAEVQQLRILNNVPAWDVDWSPSGDQLAIGTLDGVLLCQCDSFENPETLVSGINAYRVAYSPDGTWLAVGTTGSPAQVQVWDLTTGALRFSLEVAADVLSLEFSHTGNLLAVGLANSYGVVIATTASGQQITHYQADGAVDAMAFTPDDQAIIYSAARNLLRKQPLDDDLALDIPTTCTLTDLKISPDGARLVGTTFDCCVSMIDLTGGDLLYQSICGQAFSVDFNQDGSLFVTGNQDGTLHFLDTETGEGLATINAHQDQITKLKFHPDGTRVVTAGLDNTVRVFGIPSATAAGSPCSVAEIPEGEPSGEILYHAAPITGGAGSSFRVLAWCGDHEVLLDGALSPVWSPDGTQIAFQYVNPDTGQAEGIWLANADGSNLRAVSGSEPRDRAPAWSPDGAFLVFESSRDWASGLYVVDLEIGDVTQLVESSEVTYERPTWSPDGMAIAYLVHQSETRRLYTIGPDGTNPRRLTDLDHVLSTAWSRDGNWLAIAIEQAPFTSNIAIVDVQTGSYQTVTEGFADTFPVWSPDQRYIAFVRGDTLMLIHSDGTNQQTLIRLPGTFSTGLSWKAFGDEIVK